jgi:PTS system cellobiose-specific IIC component
LSQAIAPPNNRFVTALTALSDNTYLSAIRAGMVAVVPLTIIGGLFMIVANPPAGAGNGFWADLVRSWEARVAPHLPLLQIPVTATFGLLAVVACFAIAFDLGTRLRQDALVSAVISTVIFMMIQINPKDQTFITEGMGSKGLFTAILVALICVRIVKLFTDLNLVIKLPASVPQMVYESFLSLIPLAFLVLIFWLLRYVAKIDINQLVQLAFKPLVFALNTLPGILVYAFLITILWSVGINGDNVLEAVVAPIFYQYLAENITAMTQHQPLPYITANGFFSTFVNLGGTGATIALAIVLWNSREPGYRKVARLSMPTQIFNINEPIFFGLPIVLNPILMIPYVLCALILTTGSYLLMYFNLIHRPFVPVPWTTPPILGQYLVTGGDWRAALWGAISIVIAMLIYWPFAKAAQRQRLAAELKAQIAPQETTHVAV